MRREKTIGRKMAFGFLLAALIPVFLFAFVSLLRMRNTLEETMTERINSNLRNSNQCLNMVLDKYETILYNFCTEDTIVETVQKIINGEDDMNVNGSILRRELSHLCNSNPGVEGITILLRNGNVLFYDSLTSSSTISVWADKVKVPDTAEGNVYQGVTEPVFVNEKEVYFFQIGRKLIDYRNIHEQLGAVVLSINEEKIQEAIESGTDNHTFLLKEDIVLSASDSKQIGKNSSDLEKGDAIYTQFINEKTGFIIWDEQPTEDFKQAILEQVLFLFIIAIASCVIMLLLIMIVIKPYLKTVDVIVGAMNELEKGNFDVAVDFPETMPVEIKRIGTGFNDMAGRIEDLVGQVKEAVVEQKNAEISALEAQIDPHFLYNTLDVINWKAIEKEQYDISGMVGALADILRYSVYKPGGMASIQQALFWLEQYAFLQQAKLGKPFKIQWQVPEEVKGYKIHKLLLQPFLENAIKHGVGEDVENFCLTVSMRLRDEQLHVMIEDNGKGISKDTIKSLNDTTQNLEGHVGIANVRKRLKLYYGDAAGVYFESEPGIYTRVHVFIPVKEGEE